MDKLYSLEPGDRIELCDENGQHIAYGTVKLFGLKRENCLDEIVTLGFTPEAEEERPVEHRSWDSVPRVR